MYTNPDASEFYATEMVERSEHAVERAEEIDVVEQMGGVYPAPTPIRPSDETPLSPEQAEYLAEQAVAETDSSIAYQDTGIKLFTPEQAEKEALKAVVHAQRVTAKQSDGFEARDPVQSEYYATETVVKSDEIVASQSLEG